MSDADNTKEAPQGHAQPVGNEKSQKPAQQPEAQPQANVQTQPNVQVNVTPRVVVISVRMSEKEKVILEKLTQYLYKAGKIQDASMSEAMRLCMYFTAQEIGKEIERERYGERSK